MRSTPPLSSEQFAPSDQLHALEVALHEMRRDMHYESRRIAQLEEGQKLLLARIERSNEARREAVSAIERKISSAILWLALGAGGLLLKMIGPKIGL